MDPHCFDADPDPDPDPGEGGVRSAKNVHPPWQNPRYAPVSQYKNWIRNIRVFKNRSEIRYVTLKSAFSAPRIWTVLAGCLARFMRLPAWEMRRAPTSSPTEIKVATVQLTRLTQCFGSGFNKVSGSVSGSGFGIRIQEDKNDQQK